MQHSPDYRSQTSDFSNLNPVNSDGLIRFVAGSHGDSHTISSKRSKHVSRLPRLLRVTDIGLFQPRSSLSIDDDSLPFRRGACFELELISCVRSEFRGT